VVGAVSEARVTLGVGAEGVPGVRMGTTGVGATTGRATAEALGVAEASGDFVAMVPDNDELIRWSGTSPVGGPDDGRAGLDRVWV